MQNTIIKHTPRKRITKHTALNSSHHLITLLIRLSACTYAQNPSPQNIREIINLRIPASVRLVSLIPLPAARWHARGLRDGLELPQISHIFAIQFPILGAPPLEHGSYSEHPRPVFHSVRIQAARMVTVSFAFFFTSRSF